MLHVRSTNSINRLTTPRRIGTMGEYQNKPHPSRAGFRSLLIAWPDFACARGKATVEGTPHTISIAASNRSTRPVNCGRPKVVASTLTQRRCLMSSGPYIRICRACPRRHRFTRQVARNDRSCRLAAPHLPGPEQSETGPMQEPFLAGRWPALNASRARGGRDRSRTAVRRRLISGILWRTAKARRFGDAELGSRARRQQANAGSKARW